MRRKNAKKKNRRCAMWRKIIRLPAIIPCREFKRIKNKEDITLYLGHLSWKKAKQLIGKNTIAAMPIGCVEPHGNVGPLGSDYLIADEMAKRLEEKFPQDLLMLPSLPYGNSPNVVSFPGAIDIDSKILIPFLDSIVKGVMNTGVKKFIFVNGHGGNDYALDQVCFKIYDAGGIGAYLNWWSIAEAMHPDRHYGHGAGAECSLVMGANPALVDKSLDEPWQPCHPSPALISKSSRTVLFKGIPVNMIRDAKDANTDCSWRNPGDEVEKASKEWGDDLYGEFIAFFSDFVEELKKLDPIIFRRPAK
jgi:creatinine amidohydrolase